MTRAHGPGGAVSVGAGGTDARATGGRWAGLAPWAQLAYPEPQAPRLRRRRSRSERPPQMPKRSSCSSAYSRHSVRTSQERHTFFASLVEPPFSGKKVCRSCEVRTECLEYALEHDERFGI